MEVVVIQEEGFEAEDVDFEGFEVEDADVEGFEVCRH